VAQDGVVQIHGRNYVTVAKRVELGHEDQAIESIETEVLSHDPVVVRAKVKVKGNMFTGISSVSLNSTKQIEQQNPYEVAETSAVGRALGFAGYGVIDSIASADEMTRAVAPKSENTACRICGLPAEVKAGTTKTGKPYQLVACSSGNKAHNQWLWK
jgi:hypothetical protein